MTNKQVITLFLAGAEKGKTQHLKIEENRLINYNTTIAKWNGDKSYQSLELEINCNYYSRTTSNIQNEIARQINKIKKDGQQFFFIVLTGEEKQVAKFEKIMLADISDKIDKLIFTN